MPQIEQTLESLTAEFSHYTFLKATLIETDHSRSLDSGLRRNDINEVVVGSVRAYVKDDICYISRLVVLPEYQNQGIGRP